MSRAVDDGAWGIGRNVRAARPYRGMSLDALAGLVGRSKGWLSKIENGKIRLDKRSDIVALAEALEVSATDLVDAPVPRDRAVPSTSRLRDILLNSSLDDPPDMPVRPVGVLEAEWDGRILAAWRGSDRAELARLIPGFIGELHVHAATADGRERERALRLLIWACSAAGSDLLKAFGQLDLAWIAADRAEQAARLLGDEVWFGAAAFAMAHCRRSLDLARAFRTIGESADRVEPYVGDDRRAQEIYGMLRLSAALGCQIRGDHAGARDCAEEAERIADRTGEHVDAWQWFGPANVGVWRATLAVEAGEPERALEHASRVVSAALPSRIRRASVRIEKARAYAMLNRPRQAATELREAEKQDAPRTHSDPFARELVADLLVTVGGRDVRGLAWRMNLI
ncbi:helix-turn-helix domain-containing protein [Nonomuraea phyllanthi]|uniref:helix-turn-helix domain-containing protein n=1 Tax=Nonomuraea phyllanthi TaxID=2219224 RepID=UPI0012940FCB|nr:helix-turn-helix transcriptional regulator [Nonomuraea phyllanthi]QFY12556.1 helix-turn-helix domain-containing protein [Nonomuraea phyllanthi]